MVTIRQAEPSEVRRVLRMTLAVLGLPWAQLERQIDGFLHYARILNLDLSRNWVAQRGAEWLAAVTCIESPGRTGMVFLSHGFDEPARRDATVALLKEVRVFAQSRCLRLIQVLLDPASSDPHSVPAAGFTRLARLDYLDRPTSAMAGLAPGLRPPPDLRWLPFSDQSRQLFAETILATYRDSRDCPGLNGLRTIDDIIAGHQASAKFDPAWWLLLCDGSGPLGCLLLGEIPLRNAAEVIYMGLTPPARGKKLADHLIVKAIALARSARLNALTLAVDAANVPAIRVYGRFGFRRTMSRDAWIVVLDSATKG